MNSSSDEELVVQILDNNQEALGELFRRYHKPLFNFTYRFTGDFQQAEDLTSEIFLRVHRYLKSFDQSRRFKSWIYKIATNTCLAFSSQKSKTKTRSLFWTNSNDEVEMKIDFKDEKVDLELEVEKNELSQKVQAALNSLPEKFRIALYLYYFEELKYEEIAEDLGLPVNTVRTHIRRGKEKLKQELRDYLK
jgi:RNA polymerase sigma-70 factor (ECF subfamily)